MSLFIVSSFVLVSLRCGERCVGCALRERCAWVFTSTRATGGAFSLFVAVGLQICTACGTVYNSEAFEHLAALIAAGKVRFEETEVKGIDQFPAAFIDLMGGKNTGKMLVALKDGHTKAGYAQPERD